MTNPKLSDLLTQHLHIRTTIRESRKADIQQWLISEGFTLQREGDDRSTYVLGYTSNPEFIEAIVTPEYLWIEQRTYHFDVYTTSQIIEKAYDVASQTIKGCIKVTVG